MGKQGNRDTTKYHLKDAGKIVHRGITRREPGEREGEHQTEFPGATLTPVGRKTTWDAGLKWEREGGKRPYKKGK